MKGNLASLKAAVIKVAGHERVLPYRASHAYLIQKMLCFAAINEADRIKPDDVLVIRYEGPRGGPGMREMLAVTAAIKGIPALS